MWDRIERERSQKVEDYDRKRAEKRRRLGLWIRLGVAALIFGTISFVFMMVDYFGWRP